LIVNVFTAASTFSSPVFSPATKDNKEIKIRVQQEILQSERTFADSRQLHTLDKGSIIKKEDFFNIWHLTDIFRIDKSIQR